LLIRIQNTVPYCQKYTPTDSTDCSAILPTSTPLWNKKKNFS